MTLIFIKFNSETIYWVHHEDSHVERSAVKEVGCHEQFQGDLWGDGELRDLGGGVGVPEGEEGRLDLDTSVRKSGLKMWHKTSNIRI